MAHFASRMMSCRFDHLILLRCLARFVAWSGLAAATGVAMAADPQPRPPPSSFRTEQVEVRLVPAHAAVRPGKPITIGLHQRIIPHWHTYWANPGDSGVATTIEWTLPAGAQAGGIQWPIPTRFDLGSLTNYGYEKAVTLLSELTVPSTLQVGKQFEVRAKVNWLVCAEVCIPQEAVLALTLPVEAGPAPGGEGGEDALIAEARAALPETASWSLKAPLRGRQLALELPAAARDSSGATTKEVQFFPLDWGRIDHNAAQPLAQAETAQLLLQTGESPPAAGQPLPGVLVVTEMIGGQPYRKGFQISPVVQSGEGPPLGAGHVNAGTADRPAAAPALSGNAAEAPTLMAAIALAFVGGLILNLMPCVFPVLSIKALSLVQHGGRGARAQGLAYTGGVLASFALLAGLLLALKGGGAQVGWGFQFQSPLFVLAMAYLMLAVGLNLSGVYSIGGSLTGLGGSLAAREGLSGSFFTGVLATVVATPCTAPFMGSAIGFALGQPAPMVLAVFLSLGMGLAAPYLLLSGWPALQRRLPRPGPWMVRFKELLAFPMYAAAAWLVWVLAQQAGVNAAGAALLGMVAIAFAAWLYGHSRGAGARGRHAGTAAALLSVVLAFAGARASLSTGGPVGAEGARNAVDDQHWQPYSPARLDELRAQARPVFVNLTAAWCITCLANERVALSQPSVTGAFRARGITYLKGDWTRQDPDITTLLSQFGRSGVPLYLYYPPGTGSVPVVLPQILTPDIVLSALKDTAADVAFQGNSAPNR